MSNLPSSEAYVAEPIRFPALTVVDVTTEAAAVPAEYRNQGRS